jgi:hypothetical protein
MLGITPTWMQLNGLGGASGIGGIARAAAAIRDGLCTTVLVLASDAQSSGKTAEQGAQRWEFQYPVGLRGPVGAFGLLTQRYRHQYQLKDEALAKLAVTQRNHAILNANACEKLRKPLTEQDYLTSKYVSEPLRMLDSVMVCDGANAVIVTSTENAKRLGAKKMIHPTGYGELLNFNGAVANPDITESGFTVAAFVELNEGMTVDVEALSAHCATASQVIKSRSMWSSSLNQGFCAHRETGPDAELPGCASQCPGQQRAGAAADGPRESGQADLRIERQRLVAAHQCGIAEEHGECFHTASDLPGQRAGSHRFCRRPDRLMIELGPQAIPYIKSGRLKVLAVSTATRSEAMPEVPTIAESGVPGFYAFTWFALYAPAGTPKEIIERVHASMAKVFGEPAMKERLATIGAEVALTTPDGLAAFQASETAKWSAVIKRAGIRPE